MNRQADVSTNVPAPIHFIHQPTAPSVMRPATPTHESVLPDHVPPMVMPETRADARLLAFLLSAGCFPTYKREPGKRGPDTTRGRKPVSTCGDGQGTRDPVLQLSETELKARGA